jgi:hypothetical protein
MAKHRKRFRKVKGAYEAPWSDGYKPRGKPSWSSGFKPKGKPGWAGPFRGGGR